MSLAGGCTDMGALDDARARISIADAWQILGLPGKPSRSCHSPFRADSSPSFSVYADFTKWYDHATGEGGDVVDFGSVAQGIDLSAAAKWLIEQAGGMGARGMVAARRVKPRAEVKPRLTIPPTDKGAYREVLDIKDARGLPATVGIERLITKGLLRFMTLPDGSQSVRCWALLDPGRIALARRVDGIPWQSIQGNPKAKLLRGSNARWPIGASLIGDFAIVGLVEGGPDALALATADFMESDGAPSQMAIVAMASASPLIDAEALPYFKGRYCRIYAHHDQPGEAAAGRWSDQLTAAGATVDVWQSDQPGEDLNDYYTRTYCPDDHDAF